MRSLSARAIVFILIAYFPLTTFAQSTFTGTLQQYYSRYQGNSQMAQAIAALGNTPIMQFPIPVLFGVSIGDFTPNFGDPRPGGRTHEGEDIMADLDTPIVAPTAGVVLRTETGVSEGNAVYMAAPGGYTYVYMHLDHFGEGVVQGEVVQPGSLLGYVGNTGDAAGGPTHLHFEVHDPSGTPIDPMPFLTQEFTPAQKISFLNTILGVTADPTNFSQVLVTNFRSYFVADQSVGITLPPLITGALASVPVGATATVTTSALPAGDLALGSSGSAVVSLQQFLINKNTGPAAVRLSGAGATGNFGAITEAALIEYQTAQNISPADGYYGASTRTLATSQSATLPTSPSAPAVPTAYVPVVLHAIVPGGATTTVSTASVVAPTATHSTELTLTRDLSLGMSGQDVLELQQFLNANGFVVATSGAGSPGNETTHFGPATLAAVVRFQQKYTINPTAGYVGSLTRAALVTFL